MKGSPFSDEILAIVGVCREDNRSDVDEAYGAGTYDRLFPSEDDACPDCGEARISNEHMCGGHLDDV